MVQYTLPGRYFTSTEIFQEELERIFYNHWVCVGRAEQIGQPGDYFTQEIGTENVILLRDEQGLTRAFYNVCRHRGTRMCLNETGRFAKTIQCPYHAWTYSLDGCLIGVPGVSNMKMFDKKDYPLHSVKLESWEGFLFINMSPEPEPFAKTFGPIVNRFSKWHIPNLVSVRRKVYDVKANWKLIAANYNECYHCPLIHPELNRVASADSGDNEMVKGLAVGGYMTFREEMETMSLTGQGSSIPLGEVNGEDLNRAYFYTLFPNLLLSVHPDYVMFHTLWPQGVDRTRVVCEWLFDPETSAQPDFDPGDVVEFWDRTNRQDWHACEISQLGVRSRAYTPGPYYHWHELLLAEFDQQVLRALERVEERRERREERG
jgi:Rieske 2Fe-2S family protein